MVALTAMPLAAKPALVQHRAVRAVKTQRLNVRASSNKTTAQDAIVKGTAFASLTATLLASGNAHAAMEVANIAAGDGRGGLLFVPLAAALGWVGLNIAGPAANQISDMSAKQKSVLAGLGLGAAALLSAESANAATEAMQLADGDGRGGLVFVLLSVALGWVAFNIAGPAANQISDMSAKQKGLIAGLGLGGASLFSAQAANAATEAMQLADGDGRGGLVFVLLSVALGWVAFNIAGPAANQISDMSAKQKGLIAGLGLGGASLFSAQAANAATEAMQLADGDGRGGLVFVLLTVALGWVAFNIAGPAANQISDMNEKKK